MKIQNLKKKVIGPMLLFIPMACMHLGDGHHSGHGHFSALHPSYQHSAYKPMAGVIIAQEAVTSERDPNNH